jgi:hypothetical protein
MFQEGLFVESFVLDPIFSSAMRTHLFTSLHLAPELLSDAYIACARRFAKASSLDLQDESPGLEFASSARAVQTLRTVSGHVDSVHVLTLGLGIITFDLLTSGLHAVDICRFTLDMVNKLPKPDLAPGTPVLGLFVPLNFLDAFNCLVHRRIPVTKLHLPEEQPMDRYMGICGALLPHLYDMCVISHSLSCCVGTLAKTELYKQLGVVEFQIRAWIPSAATASTIPYPAALMNTAVMQARIHRCALLLVIQRLRFPFGSLDNVATSLSREILEHIDSMYQGTGTTTWVGELPEYRLNFPFLIAAAEATEPCERKEILDKVSVVVSPKLYRNLNEMMRTFLLYVWRRRDKEDDGHWLDWVPEGPPVVLF